MDNCNLKRATPILEYVKQYKRTYEVSLSGNIIDEEGLMEVLDTLPKLPPKLHIINLSHNPWEEYRWLKFPSPDTTENKIFDAVMKSRSIWDLGLNVFAHWTVGVEVGLVGLH